jgi:hypothetical protein
MNGLYSLNLFNDGQISYVPAGRALHACRFDEFGPHTQVTSYGHAKSAAMKKGRLIEIICSSIWWSVHSSNQPLKNIFLLRRVGKGSSIPKT